MKINVNEYNEILSYEGTPVELAEFIATGILNSYYAEDCGCDVEDNNDDECQSVIVPDEMYNDDQIEKSSEEITNLETIKMNLKRDLEETGMKFTDEEFEDAFNTTIEITKSLKELFE